MDAEVRLKSMATDMHRGRTPAKNRRATLAARSGTSEPLDRSHLRVSPSPPYKVRREAKMISSNRGSASSKARSGDLGPSSQNFLTRIALCSARRLAAIGPSGFILHEDVFETAPSRRRSLRCPPDPHEDMRVHVQL